MLTEETERKACECLHPLGHRGKLGGGAYKLLLQFTTKVNLNCRVIAKNDMEGRLQQASQKNKA